MGAALTVLGAGSILPRVGYGCSGYALRPTDGGPVTLLDCGPGSIRGLAGAGIELLDVRRVVFSHYHLDHCLDLFALFFARHNPRLGALPRLELFGPVGLERLVGEAPRSLGRWARDKNVRTREVGVDAGGTGGFETDDLAFRCFANGHCPEAVSWRVEGAFGSLAYTGDTGWNPGVAALAQGVDLFVSECSFPDAAGTPNHLTPTEVGRLAEGAGVPRLVLSHFYPELEPEAARAGVAAVYRGEIELARDGSVHPLGG